MGIKNSLAQNKLYEVLDPDGDIVVFGLRQDVQAYFGVSQSTIWKAIDSDKPYKEHTIVTSTYTSLIEDLEGNIIVPTEENYDKIKWKLQTAQCFHSDMYVVYPPEGEPYIVDDNNMFISLLKNLESGCLV